VKVLVLSHGFQPEYEAGFCNGLAAQGLVVTLVGSDLTRRERLDPRIEFVNLRGSQDPARPAWAKALNLLRYLARTLLLVARRRHDVVHEAGHFPSAAVGPWVAWATLLRMLARRHVYTVHNLLPHDRDTPALRRTLARLYTLPHALVVHTPRMRDALVAQFGVDAQRITVMEHGIDRFPPPPAPRDGEGRIALLFGNLAPYKGADLAIDALAAAPADWRLVIAGRCVSAALRADLQARIAASPARERIAWTDRYVGDDELRTLFDQADVLLLPYRRIDQSGVLFMALAAGLPVIAADVGSFADYVRAHAGAVVPPGDAAALAAALARTARTDPAERAALAARARRLDWRQTTRVLPPLYAGGTPRPAGEAAP